MKEIYRLSLITGRDVDELREWPLEKFDEWRAFLVMEKEDGGTPEKN